MKAIFLVEHEKGENLSALIEKLKDRTKFFAKPFSLSLHCRPLKKRYNHSYIYQDKIYFPIRTNLFFLGNKMYIDFYSSNLIQRKVISDEEINHRVLRVLAGLNYNVFLVRQIIYADIANSIIRDLTDEVKIVGTPAQSTFIKTKKPPLKEGKFLTYGVIDNKHIYASFSDELESCPGIYGKFQVFSKEIIHQLIYPGITITEINGLFYPTYKGYPELLVPLLKAYTMAMKIPDVKGFRYEYIPYSFPQIGKKKGIVEKDYKVKILKPCKSYEEANEVLESIKAKMLLSFLR